MTEVIPGSEIASRHLDIENAIEPYLGFYKQHGLPDVTVGLHFETSTHETVIWFDSYPRPAGRRTFAMASHPHRNPSAQESSAYLWPNDIDSEWAVSQLKRAETIVDEVRFGNGNSLLVGLEIHPMELDREDTQAFLSDPAVIPFIYKEGTYLPGSYPNGLIKS
jgi:hypothetical protein